MQTKDDIITLREALKNYFIRCYYLCEGNRTDLARRLDISIRTVRNHCTEFGLKNRREIGPEELPTVNLELEKPTYGPEFDCIQFVTEKERDDWYNRDYY